MSGVEIETYFPSFIAGMNLSFLAAAIAISVNPWDKPETTLMVVTCPFADKVHLRTTSNEIRFILTV
ncbi:MAG TPA: hypothetical protein VFU83_01065 [Pyrinomonadaceae bacterium]|nr:hypothetical protein [Pyrinomonadaceae bacterium]